jgi:hypothetical protein
MPRTDHSHAVTVLRTIPDVNVAVLAADLLEMHDSQSLSLDEWPAANKFVCVQVLYATGDAGFAIQPNGA